MENGPQIKFSTTTAIFPYDNDVIMATGCAAQSTGCHIPNVFLVIKFGSDVCAQHYAGAQAVLGARSRYHYPWNPADRAQICEENSSGDAGQIMRCQEVCQAGVTLEGFTCSIKLPVFSTTRKEV
jgi:hypothetical protein